MNLEKRRMKENTLSNWKQMRINSLEELNEIFFEMENFYKTLLGIPPKYQMTLLMLLHRLL